MATTCDSPFVNHQSFFTRQNYDWFVSSIVFPNNIGTEEPHYYLTVNDTVKVVVNSEVTKLPVSWFEFANGLSLQLGQ